MGLMWNLPLRQSEGLVVDLATGIGGNLNHESKFAVNHFPLVDIEARHNSEELTEVRLVEGSLVRALDHERHSLKSRRPAVMSLAMKLEVDLELFEEFHEMVKSLGQWQIENFTLNLLDLLLFFHLHLDLCSLRLPLFVSFFVNLGCHAFLMMIQFLLLKLADDLFELLFFLFGVGRISFAAELGLDIKFKALIPAF